jgi:hypothetical protein
MKEKGQTRKRFWFRVAAVAVILAGAVWGSYLWYDSTVPYSKPSIHDIGNGCVVVLEMQNTYGLRDLVLEQKGPDGTVELLRLPHAIASSEPKSETFELTLEMRPGEQQDTMQLWAATFAHDNARDGSHELAPIGKPIPTGVGQLTVFKSMRWQAHSPGFRASSDPETWLLGQHSFIEPGKNISERTEYEFHLKYAILTKPLR